MAQSPSSTFIHAWQLILFFVQALSESDHRVAEFQASVRGQLRGPVVGIGYVEVKIVRRWIYSGTILQVECLDSQLIVTFHVREIFCGVNVKDHCVIPFGSSL